MKKIFMAIVLLSVFLAGCKTTVVHDDFSDEEYIWENWTHSTNRIEMIIMELP